MDLANLEDADEEGGVMDSLPKHEESSHGPAELPSDYQAFRRAYRWPLLYGPWALGFVGLASIFHEGFDSL